MALGRLFIAYGGKKASWRKCLPFFLQSTVALTYNVPTPDAILATV